MKQHLLNISLLILGGITIILFYYSNILTALFLLIILIIGLIIGYRKNDLLFALIGAIGGTLGEIIVLHFSDVYIYTHTTFLKISIWAPIAWAIITLVIKRTTELTSKPNQELNEKQTRKQKIIEYIKQNQKITNNQVEELLGVSDTTAYRYLEELEREREIVQHGKTGRAVEYRLK